jgi:hypothetical protein
VLVVGAGGLAITQLGDRKTPQVPAADVQELVDFAIHHKTQAQTLGGNAQEISARGVQELYVYGRGVPAPRPGFVYRLWAMSATGATHLRDFLPPGRTVLVRGGRPVDIRSPPGHHRACRFGALGAGRAGVAEAG